MKKIRLIEWLVPFPAPHCAGLVEKLVPPPRLCNSLRVEIYNKSVTRTIFNIRNEPFIRCPRHSRIPSKGISAEKKTRVSAKKLTINECHRICHRNSSLSNFVYISSETRRRNYHLKFYANCETLLMHIM